MIVCNAIVIAELVVLCHCLHLMIFELFVYASLFRQPV